MMPGTYPLPSVVVQPGATYRDLIRPEGQHPIHFRARVIRRCGPQFPPYHWIVQIIQCADRRLYGCSVIVAESHIYTLRVGRGIEWAGKPLEVLPPLPGWWPRRPDDRAPYAGLQVP